MWKDYLVPLADIVGDLVRFRTNLWSANLNKVFLFTLSNTCRYGQYEDKKCLNRDRTRTCNPQIRSLVPYPFGHTVPCFLWILILFYFCQTATCFAMICQTKTATSFSNLFERKVLYCCFNSSNWKSFHLRLQCFHFLPQSSNNHVS